MSKVTTVNLRDVKAGDIVVRILGGLVAQKMEVTRVTDTRIECDFWVFDRATGMEIDDLLHWGPEYGGSGSYIFPEAK